MKEITIDLNRIREALPKAAKVTLQKKDSVPFIECFVYPSLSDKDFVMCIDWQRDIIGKDNVLEFYTEETGRHWHIYLKRQVINFINVSEGDINSFTNIALVENGQLIKP